MVGEEFGADAGEGERWIVDPIDATKNYVRGIPIFATLIALEDRVAVVSAPALGKRWWAVRGQGAVADGRSLRVSRVERIEDAVLTYTSLHGADERFLALAQRSWAPRGFGDFWQYMLLAEGAVDVCVESSRKPVGSRGAEADRRGGGRQAHRPHGRRPRRRRQRPRLERPAARRSARRAERLSGLRRP